LLAVLDAAFPPGHARRGELESFLAARFVGGRDAVAAGRVDPRVRYPPRAFSPALIDGRLEGLGLLELSQDELDWAGLVLAAVSDDAALARLAELPPVQLARARRWLGAARLAVRNVPEARGSPQRRRTARGAT
jgi:hypothetical protein